jgi:ketosteroid isomerase-like protein
VSNESTTVDLAANRRAFEAFDRGDFDGAVAAFWPDVVLDMSPVGMGVFEGREAARDFYEDWRGSYEDYGQVIEEVCDLGNGVGFAVVAAHGRLRGSASRLELRYAGVGIWREGLVERFTTYTNIRQARADAERLAGERG